MDSRPCLGLVTRQSRDLGTTSPPRSPPIRGPGSHVIFFFLSFTTGFLRLCTCSYRTSPEQGDASSPPARLTLAQTSPRYFSGTRLHSRRLAVWVCVWTLESSTAHATHGAGGSWTGHADKGSSPLGIAIGCLLVEYQQARNQKEKPKTYHPERKKGNVPMPSLTAL